MSDTSNPQTKRVTMVCDQCGSDDVVADAYASWSVPNQRWEIASVMDNGHYCNACDRECGIEEEPAEEGAAA